MKNFLNGFIGTEEDLPKINFNKIIQDKEKVVFALSDNPIKMIRQIEDTYNFHKEYGEVYYLVNNYYFEFLTKLKRQRNQFIFDNTEFNKKLNNVTFFNFNKNFDIDKFLLEFENSVFFDLNNKGNFTIKPAADDYLEILDVFYHISDIKVEKTVFELEKSEKNNLANINKMRLIFDIQNSSNEKSVEVLLKNLQQYKNLEIYLIWRTGSIDFDYSHIDVDNFFNYYQAVLSADLFFTDDEEMLKLLQRLKIQVVYFGKDTDENAISFNPKNIFDIKNYIFSKSND